MLRWLSVLVGVLQTGLGLVFPEPEFEEFAGFLAGFLLIFSAIYMLVVFYASRRRNWARYFLLAWLVLGTGVYVFFLGDQPFSWRDDLPNIICSVLEVAALYWLFTGAGQQWYRANPRGQGAF